MRNYLELDSAIYSCSSNLIWPQWQKLIDKNTKHTNSHLFYSIDCTDLFIIQRQQQRQHQHQHDTITTNEIEVERKKTFTFLFIRKRSLTYLAHRDMLLKPDSI